MSDRQCSSCGGFCGRGGCKRENVKVNKQREALHIALEALEQYGTSSLNNEDAYSAAIKTICQALAEPEQEPICDKDPQGCWNVRCQLGKVCKNTTPPARKPLTDSEVFNLAADYYEGYGFKAAEFARAIERAHGIGDD